MVIPSPSLPQNGSIRTHTYTLPHKNKTEANKMINSATAQPGKVDVFLF